MQAKGYYHAKIAVDMKEEAPEQFRITIKVDPGEPVRIDEIHLHFKGAVLQDPEMLERAKRAFALKKVILSRMSRGKTPRPKYLPRSSSASIQPHPLPQVKQ